LKLTEKRLKLDSKDGWQLSPTEIYDILSNQEKGEMYNKFEKGLGWAREMIQENKQLKEKLEQLKMFFAQFSVENGELIRVDVKKLKALFDAKHSMDMVNNE